MGMWNITILGTGAHHNYKTVTKEVDGRVEINHLVPDGKGDFVRTVEGDADLLFKEFVEKLKSLGHSISHASFTVGGTTIV